EIRSGALPSFIGLTQLTDAVVYNDDLSHWHLLLPDDVLANSFGVRDDQIGEPVRETLGKEVVPPALLESAEATAAGKNQWAPDKSSSECTQDVGEIQESVGHIWPFGSHESNEPHEGHQGAWSLPEP